MTRMTEPVEPLRILVADDHAAFRDGLTALLTTVDDIAVASPVLVLLRERLGLDEVTEQAVGAALDGLISAPRDLQHEPSSAILPIARDLPGGRPVSRADVTHLMV